MTDEQIAALELNSPLMWEIEQIIVKSAVEFADRREAGKSASMNGALDYTSLSVLEAVRRHLGMVPLA